MRSARGSGRKFGIWQDSGDWGEDGMIPYEAVYLITYMFLVWLIAMLFRILAGKPCHRGAELAAYTVYFLIITGIYLKFSIPVLNFVVNIIGLSLISLLYQRSLRKNLLTVLIIYIILLVAELIGVCICGFIPDGIVKEAGRAPETGLILQCIIAFLLVALIRQSKALKEGSDVPWKCWICIFMIPLVSVIFILSLSGSVSRTQMVWNALLILIMDFLVIFLYDYLIVTLQEKSRIRLIEEQNKGYAREIASMKEAQEKMRILRHDMKNHLLSIQMRLEKGKYDQVEQYLGQLTMQLEKDVKLDSGNMDVDSMLQYKSAVAAKAGIKLELDVKVPDKLRIEPLDLTILLGNLLDNAIAAAQQVPKEHKTVSIKIWEARNLLHIQLCNPFVGNLVFDKGSLKTSNADKVLHGLGLQSVRKVVEKYDGKLDITAEENIFIVKLFVYLR